MNSGIITSVQKRTSSIKARIKTRAKKMKMQPYFGQPEKVAPLSIEKEDTIGLKRQLKKHLKNDKGTRDEKKFVRHFNNHFDPDSGFCVHGLPLSDGWKRRRRE